MLSIKRILRAVALAGLISSPAVAQSFDGPLMRLELSNGLVWFAQQGEMSVSPAPQEFVTVGDSYSGVFVAPDLGESPKFAITGNLPDGLNLSAGGVSGTFEEPGVYSFSVAGVSTSRPIVRASSSTFKVSVLPSVQLGYPRSEIIGRVGDVVPSLPASVTGARGNHTIDLVSGSLPGGVTKAANGTLSGSLSAAGTGFVTYQAVDSLGRRSVPFTVNWTVHGPLQLPVADRSAYSSVAFTYAPAAANVVGTATYALEGVLPEGLSFSTSTGRITGTPSQNAVSASGLRITVTDSLGQVTSQAFSVSVSHPSVVTINNTRTGGLELKSLFPSEVWSSATPKVVVIGPDGVVGSNVVGTAALRTGSAWGGKLSLIVEGSIQGAGGSSAGANGGNAIELQADGLEIINETGEILAGGGAGGNGGNGGQGYSQNTWGPWSTWRYGGGYRCESRFSWSYYWNGGLVGSHSTTQYECGALMSDGNTRYYQIRRRDTTLTWAQGGSGGQYGVGAGFQQSRTLGTAGTAASGGAGSGGRGGDGGHQGQNGNSGAQGGYGTQSGGAGTPGGQAGWAITQGRSYTLEGAGQVAGRR